MTQKATVMARPPTIHATPWPWPNKSATGWIR